MQEEARIQLMQQMSVASPIIEEVRSRELERLATGTRE